MGLREGKAPSDLRKEKPVVDLGAHDGRLDPTLGMRIAAAVGVKLTNPGKVIYPETRITKAHLAAYYASVAGRMLPHIVDRPLSLVRCTDETLAKCFFQKHELPGMPAALHPGALTKLSGKDARILYVEDLAGLIAGVQMNTLEFHVWGSRRQKPHLPERIVFDIDPDEGLGFEHVKQAALDIRDVLGALELKSFPLLSGGKGVHVVVPLTPKADWGVVKEFCQTFAEMLAGAEPDRFVANMSKAQRKGRMFLDYLRNAEGSTAITPWSTRARSDAPVATPITWEELPEMDRANCFDIFEAATRAQGPEAWTGYFDVRQTLTIRIMKAIRR
jgi:bifunctional non-homologous end joining protein LigD